MSAPSPFDLTPIHLRDLGPGDEPRALALMDALGLDAFEDSNEERLYPFNELTRLGMRQAAEKAAELGDTIWARDESADAAADHLARQRREQELVELLRKRPPGPSNPWAAEGLQRLWELCCENSLFAAMDQLALMAPPGLGPWTAAAQGARAHSMLPVMARASGRAQAAPPDALRLCAGSPFGAKALRLIASYSDFDPGRFASPWADAAARADAPLLRDMAEMGLPASGWSERHGWRRSPWTALAERKLPGLGAELESAAALSKAGLLPDSADLEAALRRDRLALADHMELFGARPNARCVELCFGEPVKQARGPSLREPSERLWRWAAAGQIDILEPAPPRAIGYWGARGHALRWAADALLWAGNAPEAQRRPLAGLLVQALAASPLWNDPAARAKLFEPYESAGYHNRLMMRRLASALGAAPHAFESDPESSALAAFWDAAVLELSLARGSPAPARRALSL